MTLEEITKSNGKRGTVYIPSNPGEEVSLRIIDDHHVQVLGPNGDVPHRVEPGEIQGFDPDPDSN